MLHNHFNYCNTTIMGTAPHTSCITPRTSPHTALPHTALPPYRTTPYRTTPILHYPILHYPILHYPILHYPHTALPHTALPHTALPHTALYPHTDLTAPHYPHTDRHLRARTLQRCRVHTRACHDPSTLLCLPCLLSMTRSITH